MADRSNSNMEMGTSDQVLVAKQKNRRLAYILGFIALLVVIGVVVALVVVFAGNEGNGNDDVTTEGPTTVEPPAPTPPTDPTVTPPPEPDLGNTIDLEDILFGAFTAPSFNGTWVSGNEVLLRVTNGDLGLYDIDTDTTHVLVGNASEILATSGRFTQLSPDREYVVIAHNATSIFRHSFVARYSAVEIVTSMVIDIVPTGLLPNETFLQNLVWSPTGSLAFVYRNNVYYKASLTSDAVQITINGEENVYYNGIPDWVYEEEVCSCSSALWFSNDGSRMAFATFNDREVRIMPVPHYGEPGSVNYQYTRHREIHYPKVGTRNPTVSVTLRNIAAGTNLVFAEPVELDQPILRNVRFVTNDVVALMWTNRVQNILKVDLCSTTCNEIYRYTEPDGWIDNIPLIFNDEGSSFITILPQNVDGVLYKQIVQVSNPNVPNAVWTAQDRTNTAHTVGEILLWAPGDIIWYKATSVQDSAEQHIFTVNAASTVNCFTCDIEREDGGECLYNDAALSTDGTRVTVTCGGPSIPQVFIYNTDGTLVKTWDGNAEAIATLEDRRMPVTLRRSVPVAPALPNADVLIQAPADYATRTNVPLLVYVYGGPDSALVTKQWNMDFGTSLVSRFNIAVAYIDGRGSGLRGVANTFALNRRLGTVEIEDQINVTRYLQVNEPWIDASRTCIWGWSYGGYAASLAMARGGSVFRCAAAVAPVVDWHYYDTIYTERYMDIPTNNALAYNVSSLLSTELVEAYRDKRYFLVHGTEDDNVHYQHSMVLSRLLQRQDVYFTQMSYTDEDHGLTGVRAHLYHALEKFLREGLSV